MTARYDPDRVSDELIALTRALGAPDRDQVILAEGNTSQLLDGDRIAVKASGTGMATVSAEDFVVVDLEPLTALLSDDSATQADLTAALDAGEIGGRRRRGSIETLVHVAVQAVAPSPFVGHTHPTAVVGLLASVVGPGAWDRHVYSDEAVVIGRPLYVPYAQPGIELGRVFHRALARRHAETGELPALVLLGNHGIVAIAPTADGIQAVCEMAVKGARVRQIAYSAGGVAPLSAEAVDKFFARDDIAERRGSLAHGGYRGDPGHGGAE